MAYDPLAYVPNTGQAIASIGNNLAQMVAQLPGTLRQDQEFKRAEAQYRYDQDQNRDIHQSVSSLLKNKGVDASLRAPGPEESRDAYMQYVAEAISPHVLSGNITAQDAQKLAELSQQEPMQEAIQGQNFVRQQESRDPLGQIDMNGFEGTAEAQNGMVSTGVENRGGFTEETFAPASSVSIQQPEGGAYDELARMTVQAVKSGQMSPSAALDRMSKIEEKRVQLSIEQAKAKREAEQRKKELMMQGVINKSGTNQIVDKGGDPLASLNAGNIEDAGIGPVRDKNVNMNYNGLKGKGGSGGSGGSGSRDKPTASWQQYKDVESQLDRLREKDSFGDMTAFDKAEYSAKSRQAAQQLVAHSLEVSGFDYDNAQSAASQVVDLPVKYDLYYQNEPILGDGSLNVASPKVVEALTVAARYGKRASDIIETLKSANRKESIPFVFPKEQGSY